MLKLRFLLLLSLFVTGPAQAGLFSDDEAREQVKKVEARMVKLEDNNRQEIKSILDLQAQIETLTTEIRKLRGQNEELAHGLQEAEKRQKDFYVDLDTRLRNIETREEAAAIAAAAATAASAVQPVAVASVDPFDPAPENRAFETAYSLVKGGKHEDAAKSFQEFLKKYPESVHAPNAGYRLGDAQFALNDYKAALATYQELLKNHPSMPRAADVLFNIAGCQQELKQVAESQKTLKQLVAKYPSSEAGAKAKKLLAEKK